MGLEKGLEGKPGVQELETCPDCNGLGVVKDNNGRQGTCMRCKGRGKIPSARRRLHQSDSG
jgi:DnaJ-class molecular chaperone